MNYNLLTDAFDIFANCYVYGCLTYILVLFSLHLYCSLSVNYEASNKANEFAEFDFYTQVKDLLNPAIEPTLEPMLINDFSSMTIRELRFYIKENKLHRSIRDRLNKTVSNARKDELINALTS